MINFSARQKSFILPFGNQTRQWKIPRKIPRRICLETNKNDSYGSMNFQVSPGPSSPTRVGPIHLVLIRSSVRLWNTWDFDILLLHICCVKEIPHLLVSLEWSWMILFSNQKITIKKVMNDSAIFFGGLSESPWIWGLGSTNFGDPKISMAIRDMSLFKKTYFLKPQDYPGAN